MTAKITLITPPDIFENSNNSVLLMNPTDQDQDSASAWLSQNLNEGNINFYYYQGEPEIPWLLHALNVSKSVYFNLDDLPDVSTVMMSYVLSKSNVYYKTNNPNIHAIVSYINSNRVDSIEQFLERTLNEQQEGSGL